MIYIPKKLKEVIIEMDEYSSDPTRTYSQIQIRLWSLKLKEIITQLEKVLKDLEQ